MWSVRLARNFLIQNVKTLLVEQGLVLWPRHKLSLGDDLVVVLEKIVLQNFVEVAKLVRGVYLKQDLEKI